MAKTLDDLLVYQKAQRLDVAISAILRRPCWRRFRKLHSQLSASVESIGANIEEGFEQPTDRAFAHFLSIAKGSAAETAGHLRRAARRSCLSAPESESLVSLAQEIARMLGGFIRYLDRSDFQDRGRHRKTFSQPDDAGREDPGLTRREDPGQTRREDPGLAGREDQGLAGREDQGLTGREDQGLTGREDPGPEDAGPEE